MSLNSNSGQDEATRSVIAGESVPGLFTLPAFCAWGGISRSAAYNEASAGRLKMKKFGARTMIDARDAIAWRDALPPADLRMAA